MYCKYIVTAVTVIEYHRRRQQWVYDISQYIDRRPVVSLKLKDVKTQHMLNYVLLQRWMPYITIGVPGLYFRGNLTKFQPSISIHYRKKASQFKTVCKDNSGYITPLKQQKWVSSFLTAHQHIIGHSVPAKIKKVILLCSTSPHSQCADK